MMLSLIRNRVQSCVLGLFGRRRVLPSAVLAKPFLRQLLLIYAPQMKPLSPAVCVFAHHHLPERQPSAVAISRLICVDLPLASLQTFPHRLLPTFLLEPAILLEIFIEASLAQLFLEPFGWLVNQIIESLSSGHFLLGLSLHFILQFEDLSKSLVEAAASLAMFFARASKVFEQEFPSGIKLKLEALDFLIQLADVPEERVGLGWDHVESVNKVIHKAHSGFPNLQDNLIIQIQQVILKNRNYNPDPIYKPAPNPAPTLPAFTPSPSNYVIHFLLSPLIH